MKTALYSFPHYVFLILCLSCIKVPLQAQFEIIPISPIYATLDDLFKFELEYTQNDPIKVTFQFSMTSDAGMVYEASTIPVLILNGIQSFDIAKLSPLRIKQNKLYKQRDLKNVNYAFIQINSESGELLYKYVKDITQEVRGDTHNNSDKNHTWKLNGQSEVESVLSDRTAFLSTQPRNYVRAMIRPTLSIHDIPIGLNVLLSTENNASKQNLNKISFVFNAQEFKSKLNKRISDSVKELQNKTSGQLTNKLKNYEKDRIDRKFPEYKSLMSQQVDSGNAGLRDKLARVEKLEAVFQSELIEQNTERLTTLLKEKKTLTPAEALELKQLQAFQAEVSKLETELQQLKQSTDKYKQEQNEFNNLEKEIKSFKSNLFKATPQNVGSLKNLGLINKWESILSGLNKFNLGTNYPFFSKFSLNGPSVNGLQLEFNPGLFYIHLVGGKSLQERIDSTYSIPTLSLAQNLFGCTLGLGAKQTTHFHISLLDIKDKAPSQNYILNYKIRKNRILASDAMLSLFKNNLQISLDWSSSFLDPDQNITQSISISSKINKPFLKFFYLDIDDGSGVLDHAYKLNCKYQLSKLGLRLDGLYEYIGQNYHSLGAPFLQRDLKRWKLELLQTLAKNKLRLKLFVRRDDNSRDPLISTYSTQNTYYGIQASASTSFGLNLEASYAPYSQSTSNGNQNPMQEYNQKMLQFQVTYTLRLGQTVQTQTMFQYIEHFQENNLSQGNFNYKMFTFSEFLQFNKFNVSFSSSYLPKTIIQTTTNPRTLTLDGSGAIAITPKVTTQVGLQYLAVRSKDDKLGLQCSMQIQLLNNLNLELSYRKYNYSNPTMSQNNYTENIMMSTIKYTW
jgi:chemotaxis protein CheY-P-specific phosphatase CheC